MCASCASVTGQTSKKMQNYAKCIQPIVRFYIVSQEKMYKTIHLVQNWSFGSPRVLYWSEIISLSSLHIPVSPVMAKSVIWSLTRNPLDTDIFQELYKWAGYGFGKPEDWITPLRPLRITGSSIPVGKQCLVILKSAYFQSFLAIYKHHWFVT